MSIEKKVLNWLSDEDSDVGESSKCMAFTAVGNSSKYGWTPSDPSDFNRCLKLIKEIPEIKLSFDKISSLNKHWKSVIDNWDLLEKTFIDEVGFDWCSAKSAPITYKLMHDLAAKVREK
jgi:hypothetical protein